MKRILIIVFSIAMLCHGAFSQTNPLFVKHADAMLYLDHKVGAKQNFFSIGRLYNVHPRAIAAFNKLDFANGLSIEQEIRIPLTDTNFLQTKAKGIPVYYVVQEGEGLMKVSNSNKAVTLANLRSWNKLSSDKLSAGTQLVVGFLQSKELNLAIATKPVATPPSISVSNEKKEPETVAVKVAEPKELPKPIPAKEEPKPIQKEDPKESTPVSTKTESTTIAKSTSENGYFKFHFEQQGKIKAVQNKGTVTSGIFKTTSGWLDEKYYLLMDHVQPGTILKITNPSNNRSIYAKVLGAMAGIKENAEYEIRISSAGASALQISDSGKFILSYNY